MLEARRNKANAAIAQVNAEYGTAEKSIVGATEKAAASLAKAADSYEREVEAKILALTSMIEPVMILVMGVAVSFIVVSILLPIFEMNQLIR